MCHLETVDWWQNLSLIHCQIVRSILLAVVDKLKNASHSSLSLQSELTFTVCLHYTYSNMDDEIQERKEVSVGKPLVSKLNLHEPRPSRACSASSSSFSLDSFNAPGCSSFVEGCTSVGSASSTWPYYAQTASAFSTSDSSTASRSANVPEETDSLEFSHAPQPLIASKSLPHSRVNDTQYKFSDMHNFSSY